MLDDLRKEIDKLDDELIKLLNKRMEMVKKVGERKRADNSTIYRPERGKSHHRPIGSKQQGQFAEPSGPWRPFSSKYLR